MSRLKRLVRAAAVRALVRLTEPDPAPPVVRGAEERTPGQLLIREDGEFTLNGWPIPPFSPVEVLLPAGEYLPGELRREPNGWPALWVTLGGPWEHSDNGLSLRRPMLAARLSPEALMRRAHAPVHP